MSLVKLKIVNFQGHANLEIDLDAQITCITGPTGSGKSSIVRALRWLCLNRPSGLSCVRWGENRVGVQLKLGGHSISRIRKKDSNLYKLDGKEFRSFSTEVPKEVSDLLNLGEEAFQGQFDSPFWFLTPGNLAKELNKIINLERIDKCLGNIASQLRDVRALIGAVEGQLLEAQKKQEELAWVVEAAEDLVKLEKLEVELEAIETKRQQVIETATDIECCEIERAELWQLHKDGEKLVNLATQASRAEKNFQELRGLLSSLDSLETQRDTSEKVVEEMIAEINEKSAGLCPICGGRFSWNNENRPCSG